jgi:hypothetical protein
MLAWYPLNHEETRKRGKKIRGFGCLNRPFSFSCLPAFLIVLGFYRWSVLARGGREPGHFL